MRVILGMLFILFFFFKQKTAYELRISDWSSDVCSSDLHRPVADRRHLPPRPRAQIELVERDAVDLVPVIAERMHITLADRAPVDEFDPRLERALRCRDELVIVDTEHLVEAADRRNRRLAHADRVDLRRFD